MLNIAPVFEEKGDIEKTMFFYDNIIKPKYPDRLVRNLYMAGILGPEAPLRRLREGR